MSMMWGFHINMFKDTYAVVTNFRNEVVGPSISWQPVGAGIDINLSAWRCQRDLEFCSELLRVFQSYRSFNQIQAWIWPWSLKY